MVTNTAQPTVATEAGPPRPTKLLNRNYLTLWQGQAISRMGDQVFLVALAFWVKDATGSATLMGLLVALSALPSLLLQPVGGAVADRYPRRGIIVWSDMLSGLLVLSLATLIWFAPTSQFTIVWLFVVALLLAAINAFFIPAIAASVPELVPQARLAGANSMGQLSMQMALLLGQGLGGLLYRLLGAPLLFFVNGLSFIYAATSSSFVKIPQRKAEKAPNWRALFVAFRDDIVAGFRYVWRAPGLREFLLISTAINFFNTPILILLPFFVEDRLGLTSDWYGYIVAASAIGALLGYLLMLVLPLRGRGRGLGMLACFIIGPIGTIVMSQLLNPWLVLLLALCNGFTTGFVMVNVTTILQLTTPTEMRGRVFGLLGTLGGAVAPLAAGLSGVVADALNQNIPLIYGGCGAIMLTIALLGLLVKQYRQFVSYEPENQEPIMKNEG
ncbi:MAG: MFS transporter [Chloroflexaceae bacterium]|jgi:MFS family permease|nr:MFS transporter [Chloroflexaceae bacterium]